MTARPAAGRMRAWRLHAYGAPGDARHGACGLRLDTARVPPLRAPDELLVRVRAASLNPLDVAMLEGYGARVLGVQRALEGGEALELPLVPGRDFVGDVARAGPAARLRPGARVWGVVPPHRAGCHAQYVVVRDQWAGPAPGALDDAAAGGALYAALSACAALRAAGLAADGAGGGGGAGPGARVLLLGLGGVGQAALQLLAAQRAHVTVGCAGALAALARELGAARALDRHAADYEQQLDAGGPYWAVLDTAGLGGGAAARRWRLARYVTLSAPLLRHVDSRGLAAGALSAGAALLAHSARAAARAGRAPAALLPPHVRWAFFAPRAADIALLHRLAERRLFSVRVERTFPWWRAAEAYERAAQGGARGKLVLDFTGAEPLAAH